MAWDINHVVLVGRLTRDPELNYTQSGRAVCRFSIAVNRSSGSTDDNQDGSSSFFNIVAWNKTAEICKEYLAKGKQVGISGRLQQRRWSGQDGMRRSRVEIVASNVQFFGPPVKQGDQAPSSQAPSPEKKSAVYKQTAEQGGGEQSFENEEDSEKEAFLSELDDDEIPF
ncbi:MAG: single-stranded DNA-binding protein [Spirochaetota bacterium]